MKNKLIAIGIIFIAGSIGYIFAGETTTIHLSIINTFSGTVTIQETNQIEKDNILYISSPNTNIQISSDSESTYTLSGDITLTGSYATPYLIQVPITFPKTNQINAIFSLFEKGLEPVIPKPIQVFVDTLAPSIPNITTPANNSYQNGPTIISRTPSIDTGVGLDEYYLLIAANPTFDTTIYFISTPNNEHYLNTTTLPQGTLYLKVLAKDKLGLVSESQRVQICNRCDSIPPPPSGGGGGGGGTYFPPIYEKEKEITNEQRITIIENLEEQQKTPVKEEPKIGFISNLIYDKELLDAYRYAYSLGITTMPTAYQANLKGTLIRKDLAKMISEYAIKVTKKVPDNRLICDFNDIENESLETKYYTKLACKLGLMGRHANGKIKQDDFNPNEIVTRAQFGTVLSRTIFGEIHNVQTGENYERYQKHLTALNINNIMKKIDTPQSHELRGRVMLTMMRTDPNHKIQHASPK